MTCICAGPFTMYFQPIEKKYFCSDKIFSVLIGGKDFEREEIDFALMDLDDPNNGKFYHYYYFYLSHYLAIMVSIFYKFKKLTCQLIKKLFFFFCFSNFTHDQKVSLDSDSRICILQTD